MDGQKIFDKEHIAQVTRTTEPLGSTVGQVLEHSARTALTAVISLLVARSLRLPQSYWAPITTLVITQSSLGSALAVSWQRLIGTAMGAVVGAILSAYLSPNILIFAASVFILGLLCASVRADRSAYRFGGVTLAVVLITPRTEPAWQIAFQRFAEVAIGIAVALLMALVWPDRAATVKKEQKGKP